MNDAEIIRRAVKLAEGWIFHDPYTVPFSDVTDEAIEDWPNWKKDALAAQLVRQVDASKDACFESDADGTALVGNYGVNTAVADRQDRTMNALRAIVESEVLLTAQKEQT